MPSILSTNDKFGRVTIKNNLGRLDGTREQTVSVKVALYAPSAKNVTSTWLDSIVVDNGKHKRKLRPTHNVLSAMTANLV